MEVSHAWSRLVQSFCDWFMTGMRRVREGFFQSLQIVASGIGAYIFAQHVLGHSEPIFAATAAIVSLGYVRGATHARRMLEVTIGVTLGVIIGDALMLLLGRGIWQAAVILLISILVARFLDDGIIFTIQMGLQSCLVVLMTPTVEGPFLRSLDAIVGGAFAFLMMFLFPKDPRVSPRWNSQKLLAAYSDVLKESAAAMEAYDSKAAWMALASARNLQPLYATADGEVVTAKGMAQLSWLGRSHRSELLELASTLNAVDLAIRNTRVLNRRMASTLAHVQLSESAIISLTTVLSKLSVAVTLLGEAVSHREDHIRSDLKAQTERHLVRIAQQLDPVLMGVRTLEAESLVLMVRPLVVDLLEATGKSHDEAVQCLVPLTVSMTEHAPRTQQIPAIPQDPQKQRELLDQALEQSEDSSTGGRGLCPDDTRTLNIVLRSQLRGDQ
ncbi:FUSC family protein [Rothia sp. P13129]|uniref:FUSC family protein n=1 Tax=Rothia sp. P13129 TaxID=3402664 RepID=UPI003AC739BF